MKPRRRAEGGRRRAGETQEGGGAGGQVKPRRGGAGGQVKPRRGLEEPPSPRAKQESSDSCFEPVRLVQAQPLTEEHRALPPPDFSVSMKFSIQLKDSRKEPCSARYLHAVSVEYHTHAVGDEPGSVVKADLQVLGLGGSRVVVRSPANPTLAWKLSRESQDTVCGLVHFCFAV